MDAVKLLGALLVAGGFSIQPPGQFHGDEPIARDGERWLALRVDGNSAALVATTLEVRAVRDELLDEGEQRSGLEVSSQDDDKVIAYLRGSDLKGGAVEYAPFGSANPDLSGLPYEITFRAQRYRVSGECDKEPRDAKAEQRQFDCRISLKTDGRTQTLSELTGYYEHQAITPSLGDDASPALLFAGDLDRDGKLDLIFDTTDHYNVSRPTLFLSSRAGPGELLREAAQYESVGC